MKLDLIRQGLAEMPLLDYRFLKTEILRFSPRVRHICKTECPMYGKTWACPPAVGTVEECAARCRKYPDLLLLVTLQETDDIYDLEKTLATRPAHEAVTRQAEALLQEQGVQTYTLSTQACCICPACAYPRLPCRHPDQMHPCVESHGILVTDLAQECGLDFQYGNNAVTWFSLIFFRESSLP